MAFLGNLIGGALNTIGGAATSLVGGAANTALAGAEAASEQDQVNNLIANMGFNSQMMWQQTAFNQMVDTQAQHMQEVNTLRDVAMQQRRADASITKECISLIKS